MKRQLVSQANVYRFNLYDYIESFGDYDEFIEESFHFTENDSVLLYINCAGGRVDVGLSIINAIKNCNARIHAVVEGPSYSMASVIALACNDLIMLENTFLMFHNYSTAGQGKGGELMSSIKHNDAHFNKLMNQICSPFLTKRELTKIQKDEDLYIYDNDEDLDKRKARHFK